jgi:HJR/Mrr/RecB family endonuclease
MATRVIVGLIALLSIVQGLAGGMMADGGIMMLVIVLLGIIYGFMGVDAEDATDYLVVTIAVGAAASANALSEIPGIGMHLDNILDPASMALYASVASILIMRTVNRLKG